METVINFTACKHLDFDTDFHGSKKETIRFGSAYKVFWARDGSIHHGLPLMVQFCKKRGRLNYPKSCLNESHRLCNHYQQINHCVRIVDKKDEAIKILISARDELIHASELIDEWGAYASEYFRKKHMIHDDLEKVRDAAKNINDAVIKMTGDKNEQ